MTGDLDEGRIEGLDLSMEEADVQRMIETFVRDRVDGAGADGVIVALSGGLDSTVTATLAVEALGTSRVYGLILPCNLGAEAATHDARTIADGLGIDHTTVHLQPLLDRFVDQVTPALQTRDEAVALGNVIARFRMVCAYFMANTTSRIVLGTTNKTELLLGHFTKHGDGGADAFPIGDLYKTQVRDLARHLAVPEFVIEQPPTAGLWAGQTDEAELGAPYDTIDRILGPYVEDGLDVDHLESTLEVDSEVVSGVVARYEASHHKREGIATPGLNPSSPDHPDTTRT